MENVLAAIHMEGGEHLVHFVHPMMHLGHEVSMGLLPGWVVYAGAAVAVAITVRVRRTKGVT